MNFDKIEPRPDCDSFVPKRFANDCGDCQTDGHYLCAGCGNIASFDDMVYFDTRERYYYNEEMKSRQ